MSEKPLALVVEDDEKLTIIFTQALLAAGYEVESVQNGLTAMNTLDTLQPELVLLDLHLPGASGDKVLAKIRHTEHLSQVKVLLCTADPTMADALSEQPDFVFIKPVSFSQLRDMAIRLR